MVDFSRHVEETLQHLVEIAKQPGWAAKSWEAAKELAKLDPMYEALPDRLADAMQCVSESPSEPSAGSTCASTGEPEPAASSANAKPRAGR